MATSFPGSLFFPPKVTEKSPAFGGKKRHPGNEVGLVQCNPVNPITNGPPKSGRINGVVVLTTTLFERTLVWEKRKWSY